MRLPLDFYFAPDAGPVETHEDVEAQYLQGTISPKEYQRWLHANPNRHKPPLSERESARLYYGHLVGDLYEEDDASVAAAAKATAPAPAKRATPPRATRAEFEAVEEQYLKGKVTARQFRDWIKKNEYTTLDAAPPETFDQIEAKYLKGEISPKQFQRWIQAHPEAAGIREFGPDPEGSTETLREEGAPLAAWAPGPEDILPPLTGLESSAVTGRGPGPGLTPSGSDLPSNLALYAEDTRATTRALAPVGLDAYYQPDTAKIMEAPAPTPVIPPPAPAKAAALPGRFLDDEEGRPLPAAAAPDATLPGRFLDDEQGAPLPDTVAFTPGDAAALAARIDSDLAFTPNDDQLRAYFAFKKSKPLEPWNAAKQAGAGLVKMFGDAIGAAISPEAVAVITGAVPLGVVGQSGLEAGARGTADLGMGFRPLINWVNEHYIDESWPEFVARRSKEEAAKGGPLSAEYTRSTGKTSRWLRFGLGPEDLADPINSVPERVRDAWRKEYEHYAFARNKERWEIDRGITRMRELARAGASDLVPPILGSAPLQQLVEAVAPFVDASNLLPLGAGAKVARLAQPMTRTAASAAAGAAGDAARAVGGVATKVAQVPERVVGAAVEAGFGEAAGQAARKYVRAGGIGLAVAPGVGITVPGVTEVAQAVTGARAAGLVLSEVGEVAQAAGRAVGDGPSRWGVLKRMSLDGAAPEWLRHAAGAAQWMDPALAGVSGAVGDMSRGSVGGALVGSAMGFAGSAGDLEAAVGGAVSGAGLGAAGGAFNFVTGGQARTAAREEHDIARFLSTMSAESLDGVQSMGLSRPEMLKLADLSTIARGVAVAGGRGDIQFHFLKESEFVARYGQANGAVPIGTADVFVNTGHRGVRPIFHEVMHALDNLDFGSPESADLNRRLFTQVAPDGNVVSRGQFDEADLLSMATQYRARLDGETQKAWDAQFSGADGRPALLEYMRAEVRADALETVLTGKSNLTEIGRLSSRVMDSVALAHADSFLGSMRRGLQALGVQFDEFGQPSTLFFKAGQPVTHSPEVNAALLSYVRAKARVTKRLMPSEAESEFVIKPQDLQSKGGAHLVELYRNWDGFARLPSGEVQRNPDGTPVLLAEREIKRIQDRRVEVMQQTLAAVPDAGDVHALRVDANGESWSGSRFSEAQLAAIQALPDDAMPRRIKARITEFNQAIRDGQMLVIDYNAALKNGKYSSGIAPSVRKAVPFAMAVSKAGNFYATTLDVTAMHRKLGAWISAKPKAFEPWSEGAIGFQRDMATYLKNAAAGEPGTLGLDADPVLAIQKRNSLNDFFNIPGHRDANPVVLSGASGKDNLIRSRRMDRVNRVTPGAGDEIPFTGESYQRMKANLRPSGSGDEAGGRRVTESTLPHLNEMMGKRFQVPAKEIGALIGTATGANGKFAGLRLRSRNAVEKDYWVTVTRSAKPDGYQYQTTFWYDDIPFGDVATRTLEEAAQVALESGFGHKNPIASETRKGYNVPDETKPTPPGQGGLQVEGRSGAGPDRAPRASPSNRIPGPEAGTVSGPPQEALTALPPLPSLPAGLQRNLPDGVTQAEVMRHLHSEMRVILNQRLPRLPKRAAAELSELYAAEVTRTRREHPLRGAWAAQERLRRLTPADLDSVTAALRAGGLEAARKRLKEIAASGPPP